MRREAKFSPTSVPEPDVPQMPLIENGQIGLIGQGQPALQTSSICAGTVISQHEYRRLETHGKS